MSKYCGNCGHPLSDGAKFCGNCGQPLNAKNEKQNVAAESKKEPAKENVVQSSQIEPVKEDANANSQKGNAEQKKSGFISMLINQVKDYLRHPQKLIPTIVLSVIWMVLPMITGFVLEANIPVVRFISTITYANGGVFGGFFGAVGGIFGKAVFAAVVNGMVLSICAKKNPFKGLKKGFVGIIGGGTKAISPFLIGGGIGFLLYFIFNITSAPQKSAIAIVCAVSAIQAVAKQNGLLVCTMFVIHLSVRPTSTFIYCGILIVFLPVCNAIVRHILYVYLYLLSRIFCPCIRLVLACGAFLYLRLNQFAYVTHKTRIAPFIATFTQRIPQKHHIVLVSRITA